MQVWKGRFRENRHQSCDCSCKEKRQLRLFVAFKSSIGHVSDGGIVVSIAAFQAVDPGSIPGHRNSFSFPRGEKSPSFSLFFL